MLAGCFGKKPDFVATPHWVLLRHLCQIEVCLRQGRHGSVCDPLAVSENLRRLLIPQLQRFHFVSRWNTGRATHEATTGAR